MGVEKLNIHNEGGLMFFKGLLRFLFKQGKELDGDMTGLVDEVVIVSPKNLCGSPIIFKAVLDGRQIGRLNLTKYDGESIYFADIVVFHGYRCSGVGKKLISEALYKCKLSGVKRIYGVIVGESGEFIEKERLRELYKSQGFSVSGDNIEIFL